MKTHTPILRSVALLLLLIFAALNPRLSTLHAQGTAFTYQGRLNSSGSPATGSFDLEFTVYPTNQNGSPVTATYTNIETFVTNGLFAVTLDFGGVFTGSNYWLDIAVRPAGIGNYLELSPRQPLTPAPYAIFANTASNLNGTLPASQLTGSLPALSGANLTNLNAGNITSGTLPLAQLPAAALTNGESGVTIGGTNVVGALTLPPKAGATAVGTLGGAGFGEMVASGNFVYAVNSFAETFTVIDVSVPTAPVILSTLGGFHGSAHLAVNGRYAYVNNFFNSGGNTMQVIDVANPTNPVVVGTVPTGTAPVQLAAAGRYVYVTAAGPNQLGIVDVANPANPVVVGFTSAGNSPQYVAVNGNYAYVLDTTGAALQVINVSNPTNPLPVGSVSTGPGSLPTSISVSGRYAYVVNQSSNNFEIFDVGSPANPVQVGSLNAGSGESFFMATVAGRYAYITAGGGGVLIVDVSNPGNPVVAGNVPCVPESLAVEGRYLYATTGGGFQIFDMGGEYVQHSEIGELEAASLQTRDTARIGNGLDVRGGLTVSGSARISGGLSVDNGSITASNFTGNGGGLTNLNASQLTGALPAISGASLTGLNAGNISGTIPAANLPANLLTNNQSGVTLNSLTVGGPLNLTSPITITAGGGKFITSPGGGANIFVGVGSGNTNGLTGGNNSALGQNALAGDTSGANNVALGYTCMVSNLNGADNTALGYEALFKNTSGGQNIAIGALAGQNLTTTSGNIDIGNSGLSGDASTIRIGSSQASTFIAGITGVTASGGAAVYVNSSGQLGTLTSSARFKQDIKSMDDASDVLLSLHPVTFKYKHDLDPLGIPQFGLVAEEVEKADPDLVLHDLQGKIYTVRYEAVNAMLLNEFLKQHHQVEEQNSELKQQSAEIQDFNQKLTRKDADITALKDRLAALETAVKSLAAKQ